MVSEVLRWCQMVSDGLRWPCLVYISLGNIGRYFGGDIEWLSIWTLYAGLVFRLRRALSEAEGGVILAISEKTDV